nr:MAG TPA: hypothetical protein [Inoviridae sp.]
MRQPLPRGERPQRVAEGKTKELQAVNGQNSLLTA